MNSTPLRNLSAAAAVVLLLLIVTSPVTTIWLIKREADAIVSDSLRGLASSSLATLNVSEGFLETALAVNDGEPELARVTRRLEETTRRVDAEYETYRGTMRGSGERLAFDRLVACRDDYRACRSRVVDLLASGDRDAAVDLFDHDCVRKFEIYSKALGDVVEHNVREARSRGASIIRLCYVLLGIQILLFAFFFVYGFFVPLTAVLERLTRKPLVYKA